MRAILVSQLCFFLAYGLVSGFAFRAALESAEERGASEGMARAYLSLPAAYLPNIELLDAGGPKHGG